MTQITPYYLRSVARHADGFGTLWSGEQSSALRQAAALIELQDHEIRTLKEKLANEAEVAALFGDFLARFKAIMEKPKSP
jgi:hypothetical protein